MPHRTGVPLEWRLKKSRFSLVGTACECGALYFPARQVCRDCGKETKEQKFAGKGKIETYTIISAPPAGFEEYAPYAVAIVKLEEGPMVAAQIVSPAEEVNVGSKVVSVFRKLSEDGHHGIINYGLKFEVV